MLVNDFGALNGLFSSPADGAAPGAGQPGGQGAGQPAGQQAAIPAAPAATIGQEPGQAQDEFWKQYSPEVHKHALSSTGDYYSDKIDGNEAARRMLAADKGKAAGLFYAFTDLWAGHPNYVQYLVQNHPEAVKMIARAAGFQPASAQAPAAQPSAAADPGLLPEDENYQRLQAQLEQAMNDGRATKEQLQQLENANEAMINANAERLYRDGERQLDGDIDSYVAAKVAEMLPNAKPEAVKLMQASIKGGKVTDSTIKTLYYQTLTNRFSGNDLSASQGLDNLRRVIDAHISQAVPIFASPVMATNQQQHAAMRGAQMRVSPTGAAAPPSAQGQEQPGRINLRANAMARYDAMRGIK